MLGEGSTAPEGQLSPTTRSARRASPTRICGSPRWRSTSRLSVGHRGWRWRKRACLA